MATYSDIAQFIEMRDEALRKLDMDFARKQMPNASSDEVRLCAMHKARYECLNMTEKLRHDSERWLKERGYGRLNQLPWPIDGRLPE